MRHIESTADRYVRLLQKRHSQITSSPEKSKRFLMGIGLNVPAIEPKNESKKRLNAINVKLA
jgi:hypothetical protein